MCLFFARSMTTRCPLTWTFRHLTHMSVNIYLWMMLTTLWWMQYAGYTSYKSLTSAILLGFLTGYGLQNYIHSLLLECNKWHIGTLKKYGESLVMNPNVSAYLHAVIHGNGMILCPVVASWHWTRGRVCVTKNTSGSECTEGTEQCYDR